ncbi:hypothetical protein [Archaeoglobus sp.]
MNVHLDTFDIIIASMDKTIRDFWNNYKTMLYLMGRSYGSNIINRIISTNVHSLIQEIQEINFIPVKLEVEDDNVVVNGCLVSLLIEKGVLIKDCAICSFLKGCISKLFESFDLSVRCRCLPISYENQMEMVKGRMLILSMLSQAFEKLFGDKLSVIQYYTGQSIAKVDVFKESKMDIESSIKYMSNKTPWFVEIFQKKGNHRYLVVFRDCIIRQTHKTVCTKQGGILCMITHGYLEKYISTLTGKKVKLKLIHSGPNACLKELEVYV